MSSPSVREDATDVLGRRIGAGLLDVVAILVLLIAVGLLFGEGHSSGGSVSVELHGTSFAVWAILAFAYYDVPETVSGQTLGKRLMGLRVTRRDGRKASPGAILVRTLLRIVDFLPFLYLLGLLAIGASGARRRQRLGDLAARTVVRRR
jgi:uncharacterized RDD family membrane protein YckC